MNMKTRTPVTVLVLLGLALLWAGGAVRAQEEEPVETTAAEESLPVESPAASPAPAPAPEAETIRRRGELVSVFGDHIEIPAHVEQWGDIVSIGGKVTVEGTVRGDVIVINGDVTIEGHVSGSVIGVLSNLTLRGAEIGDQLVNVAGTLQKETTDIGGQQFNMGFGKGTISLARWFGVLGAFLFWIRILGLLVVFLALLLLAATVPERIRRIGEETPNRIFAAFFVGLLAYLAYWILLLLLLPTVVGFFMVLVLFFVLKWLGIAGMFQWFGQRVGRGLGREMSLLGAVLLGFAPYALLVLAPSAFGFPGIVVSSVFCLLIWIFLEIPAVGLFILTRGGGERRLAPRSSTPPEVPPSTPGLDEPPPDAWSSSGAQQPAGDEPGKRPDGD